VASRGPLAPELPRATRSQPEPIQIFCENTFPPKKIGLRPSRLRQSQSIVYCLNDNLGIFVGVKGILIVPARLSGIILAIFPSGVGAYLRHTRARGSLSADARSRSQRHCTISLKEIVVFRENEGSESARKKHNAPNVYVGS